MYEFQLVFKTPQGLISYEIRATHYIEAVSNVRKGNPEIRNEYPLTAIRFKNETQALYRSERSQE